MTALPTMSVAPLPTVIAPSSIDSVALPEASATSIGVSPLWWSGTPGLPCGFAVGLKCPPALMPSPELQSPFSWIWKPWPPGVSPETFASTATLSPFCVKVTVPAVALPLVASSRATAVWADADEQTASAPTAEMSSRRFMDPPGGNGKQIVRERAVDVSHHKRTPLPCQTRHRDKTRDLDTDSASTLAGLITPLLSRKAPRGALQFVRSRVAAKLPSMARACVTLPACSENRATDSLWLRPGIRFIRAPIRLRPSRYSHRCTRGQPSLDWHISGEAP